MPIAEVLHFTWEMSTNLANESSAGASKKTLGETTKGQKDMVLHVSVSRASVVLPPGAVSLGMVMSLWGNTYR